MYNKVTGNENHFAVSAFHYKPVRYNRVLLYLKGEGVMGHWWGNKMRISLTSF